MFRWIWVLKGLYYEIFDPLFFFERYLWVPDSWAKAVWNIDLIRGEIRLDSS
jgi:hypothetical protein